MIEQTCKLFPQIRHHIDYIEIGTPVTNKHYLAQPHGEIYGLDHSFDRLQPWTMAQLRPQTDIEGLYLTGQDACLCGFTGALFGGLLCAGVVLGRNAMGDLESLHDSLAKK
jgi:all-trans-retinol 13,14-reductase